MNNEIEIKVEVRFVVRKKNNDDGKSGWYILSSNQGTLSGTLQWEPASGEHLILTGYWSAYRGEKQFKFSAARPDIPDEPRALLHYVCLRVDGIGPKMEEAIWEIAGDKWSELKHGDVPRMSEDMLRSFHEHRKLIATHDERYQTVAYLMHRGCSQRMSDMAWEKWESETIGVVQANPYRLVELFGYGFQSVDVHREKFGIALDDNRRLLAGIEYAIEQLQKVDGSTLVDAQTVINKALSLLGISRADHVCTLISELISSKRLIIIAAASTGKNALALYSDYKNELIIWDFASKLPKALVAS